MELASSARIPDGFMAAMRLGGEKPHQGLPSKNPAPNQVREVCKFTVLLGMRGQAELNRVGPCCTGKERDAESGNDYFMARYYASSMGRFMSPDWSAKQDPVPYAKLDDPQSLNLYAYVRNNPLSRADIDGHSPDWWQKVVNKLSGNGFKTDAQLAPKPGQFTVTLNSRAANIPGGGVLHAAGADHQWITTSDGKAAGMGTAKNGGEVPDKGGQSSPDKPGAPTQVVDEHGDTPTSTHTYTNVDKGAIDSYLTPGTPTGAWIPTVNDCNTWAQNALGQSIPHDAYDRNTDTMVHNAVVYSDGSIHQVNPQ
jgi:RHS repeat-associated protein